MMPFHPLADCFPLIEGAAFDLFVADIKSNGLKEAVVVLDGQILDGRNRARACERLGIDLINVQYDPANGDPLAYVISKNLHRRHLNESQRAMVAARIAKLKVGNPTFGRTSIASNESIGQHTEISQEKAATMLNVSRPTVTRAAQILKLGSPAQIADVDVGKARVSTMHNKVRGITRQRPTRAQRYRLDKAKIAKERVDQRNVERAAIWGKVRGIFENMNLAGRPRDAARIVCQVGRAFMAVDKHLPAAITWLEEFADEWNTITAAKINSGTARGDHANDSRHGEVAAKQKPL